MLTSVIIPTFNRSAQLTKTLESIARQNLSEKSYEIIIIDNGSTDDTDSVIKQFISSFPAHNINSFYDKTPGLLTGRHLGAKMAKGEILVFADDDIYASENWLSTINTIVNDQEIQLAGGKCLPDFEIDPPNWVIDFFRENQEGKMLAELSLCDFGNEVKTISPLYIWGLNFSIRKKALYTLGGFHPDNISPAYQMFQGDGETGLSLKAIKLNYKCIYHPQNLIHHQVPKSRMTIDYFDKRFFYQGICDSYTKIRKYKTLDRYINQPSLKNEAIELLRHTKNRFGKSGNGVPLHEFKNNVDFLKIRLNSMYHAGYNFHQHAAQHKVVFDWITKSDYFDYHLPELI